MSFLIAYTLLFLSLALIGNIFVVLFCDKDCHTSYYPLWPAFLKHNYAWILASTTGSAVTIPIGIVMYFIAFAVSDFLCWQYHRLSHFVFFHSSD